MTENLQALRSWAEKQDNGDSDRALVAKRMLRLIEQIEALTEADPDKERRLGRELADLSFEVAKAHGKAPWEFFKT